MISEEKRYGNLIFVTVSDIGSNHQILCMPNQDAVGFKCDGDDFVLVVSDGVGSCKEAETGARFVVDTVLRLFSDIKSRTLNNDNREIAKTIISYWITLIGDNTIDEYCATVKAIMKIGNTAKVISLGDGIAAITSNGMQLMSPVEESSFTNETKCMNSTILPDNFWIKDLYIDTYMPYTVFCCTDGISNGIITGKEIALVNEIEQHTNSEVLRRELENLIKEICVYCSDDKTVGVVKYERKN